MLRLLDQVSVQLHLGELIVDSVRVERVLRFNRDMLSLPPLNQILFLCLHLIVRGHGRVELLVFFVVYQAIVRLRKSYLRLVRLILEQVLGLDHLFVPGKIVIFLIYLDSSTP